MRIAIKNPLLKSAATVLAVTLAVGLPQNTLAAPNQAIDVSQTIECMRANFPLSIGARRITMTTTDRQGNQKAVSGRVYALRERVGDEDKFRATLRIDSPPHLADAAYLVRETDDYLRDAMFVYLPAVGRVRRISGGLSDNSLMGTGFSYFDFKQYANAFGDLKGELLAIDEVDGRKAVLMSFKPVEGAETRYTTVQAWVDQQTCLIVRADFMQNDKVIKRLQAPASAITSANGHSYAKEAHMTDFLSGMRTTLRLDEVTINEELSDFRFNPRTFYQTR